MKRSKVVVTKLIQRKMDAVLRNVQHYPLVDAHRAGTLVYNDSASCEVLAQTQHFPRSGALEICEQLSREKSTIIPQL